MVKLYADEPGSADVRALGSIVVSALSRVEVPGAFWRKVRTGTLSDAVALELTEAFEIDLFGTEEAGGRFAALDLTQEVLGGAAHLLRVHGIRPADAIQLASAIVARSSGECETFSCFDQRLRHAALLEGFSLIPA